MNIQIESNEKSAQDNIFDPFPKPNIFPDGWDLSAITKSVKMLDDSREQKEQQMLD